MCRRVHVIFQIHCLISNVCISLYMDLLKILPYNKINNRSCSLTACFFSRFNSRNNAEWSCRTCVQCVGQLGFKALRRHPDIHSGLQCFWCTITVCASAAQPSRIGQAQRTHPTSQSRSPKPNTVLVPSF